MAPAARVLSSQFGSWGDIAVDPSDPKGGRWLCRACGWAYRCVALRHEPTVVTRGREVEHPPYSGLREQLSHGTVDPASAYIIPIGGKRVIAPRARWGTVTHDGGSSHWGPAQARLVAAADTLTRYGFGGKMLASPTPPHSVLMRIPTDEHPRVRRLWRHLDVARADKIMMPLYSRLCRKDRA